MGTNLHCCDELGESEVPLPLGIRDRPYLRTQIHKQGNIKHPFTNNNPRRINGPEKRRIVEEPSGPVLSAHLLEIGAREPGHAEEAGGVGARDAAVAICSRAHPGGAASIKTSAGFRGWCGTGAGARGSALPGSARANHSA